jgi:hypothetical protein
MLGEKEQAELLGVGDHLPIWGDAPIVRRHTRHRIERSWERKEERRKEERRKEERRKEERIKEEKR